MARRRVFCGGLCLAAAGIAAPALAGEPDCTVFFDKPGFEDFCVQHGKLIKGLEDFEPPIDNVPAREIAGPLADPLQGNVPNVDDNGWGFPNGLLNKNLLIQSNVLGPHAPTPQPGGGLLALGPDSLAENVPNSIVVGAGELSDSTDLIFLPDENHTGIGFDVLDPIGLFVVHITVFDNNNVEITREILPVTGDKTFFGIWCPVTIGRINIAGLDQSEGNGAELVDNIQMWMEPAQAPVCPCDCAIPRDKVVSVIDFLALLAQWGRPGTCDCAQPPDGVVSVTDFLALLAGWGPCPTPANDKCDESFKIGIPGPGVVLEEHFDMYGATPSLDYFYKCRTELPLHKDIWYCLNNLSTEPVLVGLSTTMSLFLEVNAGCGCPPSGEVVWCGPSDSGEQFPMQPSQQVLIRLIDHLDLPNDELKGTLVVDVSPAGMPKCAACGPGPHWIDNCPGGQDQVADHSATIALDLDLDCEGETVADLDPTSLLIVNRSGPLDDSMHFPGLRPINGHLDVIDTEIVAMSLSGGGVTVRAGAGRVGVLQPTRGAVAEYPADPFLAESFFDIFVEIEVDGQVLYNQAPVQLEDDITCVPPTAIYASPVVCTPLYTSPLPGQGQHLANLIRLDLLLFQR